MKTKNKAYYNSRTEEIFSEKAPVHAERRKGDKPRSKKYYHKDQKAPSPSQLWHALCELLNWGRTFGCRNSFRIEISLILPPSVFSTHIPSPKNSKKKKNPVFITPGRSANSVMIHFFHIAEWLNYSARSPWTWFLHDRWLFCAATTQLCCRASYQIHQGAQQAFQ